MPERESSSAPRAFWSGTISFGLVSVPVDLLAATRGGSPGLRMLAGDGTPLRRRYRCPAHDRPVEAEEIVRGFDTGQGRYIVVDDEELAALEPRKSREIDLRRFVPKSEIPPQQFRRSYILVPGGDTNRAYRLLAETMERMQLAGIATFVMRGREYPVAIVAVSGILRAETLRFADETRSPEQVGLPEAPEVSPEAVERMKRAVKRASRKTLDAAVLEDEHRHQLERLARGKLRKGQDVVTVAAEAAAVESEDVVDLMRVLKERLAPRAAPPAEEPSHTRATLAEKSKAELYERAKELDIEGRSKMSKDELIEAIARSA